MGNDTSTIMAPAVRPIESGMSWSNRWDHILARWGYKRGEHRVEPGLYGLGQPTPDSPVFVSANYTLSFDALRTALARMDAYILVIDTKGVNVWCAAGKGTFGTKELLQRIEQTGLRDVVKHRKLIVPQLGAPGVSAWMIEDMAGFQVEYGPVRAEDIPAYLQTGRATSEMRRVRFGLRDRAVLIPIELMAILAPMVIAAVVLFFLAEPLTAYSVLAAALGGVVLFPLLLPWLPTREFATKGLVLGGILALIFAWLAWESSSGAAWWRQAVLVGQYIFYMPPVTAYLALNFTGSSTYTSRTGVRKEIYTYIPVMAALLGVGVILMLVSIVLRFWGG